MTSRTPNHPTGWIKTMVIVAAVPFALGILGAPPAAADDSHEARQLVEKSRLTFESFIADSHLSGNLRTLVNKARAVLIYPQVLRGAFVIGVSGGSGVMLVRDLNSGKWGGPAFYTIGEASFGLQAGGDASEVVLVALTDRGVSALLSTSAKLGANVSIAIGPVGAGLTGATANLSADIVSYSRNQGLYAGFSLEGAVVAVRGALNAAYYGKEVTPAQILIRREVSNPQAAGLIGAVSRVTSEPLAAR
jgi:lipid-binding SYLF domain-containing protein